MIKNSEAVILVHGLGRSHLSMYAIERALRQEGYRTINWRYNSLTSSIDSHAVQIRRFLDSQKDINTIHGVGHSLGGLLLRQALALTSQKVGRFVMLGTPNKGARIVAELPLLFGYNWIPQTLRDMHPASLCINQLPLPNCDIGIIAGIERFHPLNPSSWINHWVLGDIPHDGTVDLESTRIEGPAHSITICANHSFLPSSKSAISNTVRFIRTGAFAD